MKWKWDDVKVKLYQSRVRERKRESSFEADRDELLLFHFCPLSLSIISFPSLPFSFSLSLSLSLSSLLFIDVTISVFHENNLWKLFARDSQIQLSMEEREGEKWEREGERARRWEWGRKSSPFVTWPFSQICVSLWYFFTLSLSLLLSNVLSPFISLSL